MSTYLYKQCRSEFRVVNNSGIFIRKYRGENMARSPPPPRHHPVDTDQCFRLSRFGHVFPRRVFRPIRNNFPRPDGCLSTTDPKNTLCIYLLYSNLYNSTEFSDQYSTCKTLTKCMIYQIPIYLYIRYKICRYIMYAF